ncbi:hypothetical protein CC2G_013056 [Coprinopsis cinerea AmutBmut pab1-1]|nr:hypothetical protein CC2G_013056 [Coprinopsis cinerea AmutBmut pab1-1]
MTSHAQHEAPNCGVCFSLHPQTNALDLTDLSEGLLALPEFRNPPLSNELLDLGDAIEEFPAIRTPTCAFPRACVAPPCGNVTKKKKEA